MFFPWQKGTSKWIGKIKYLCPYLFLLMKDAYYKSILLMQDTCYKRQDNVESFHQQYVIKSKSYGRIPCVQNRNTVALIVMNWKRKTCKIKIICSKISVADPDPGSGAFFKGILTLDPGELFPWSRIPDSILEFLVKKCWIKIPKYIFCQLAKKIFCAVP